MADPSIIVENLGKKYQLRHQQNRQKYLSMREVLMDKSKAVGQRFWQFARSYRESESTGQHVTSIEDFWALRDVSFEINRGESVGIIGRNGAGKSTLLKILSRITEPTTGKFRLRGRMASLLEVGTGFHPELTGRENIYLNGAVLGMTRVEIKHKFDEIVAFAEVEKFLDTPVKRYSSGMYVRLAFAVAAHLEPEILVVDEVLAVGDAAFQKKCLGKMSEVAKGGRTVLFVSHNMAAVTRLCRRAVLLKNGRIIEDDTSDKVIASYQHSSLGTTVQNEWMEEDCRAPGNEWVHLRSMRVISADGCVALAHDIRRPIYIEIEYKVIKSGLIMIPKFHVINEDGVTVFVVQDTGMNWRRTSRMVGSYISRLMIPGNFLAEGSYSVWAGMVSHDPDIVHFFEPDVLTFQVNDSLDGDSARGDYAGHMPGVVRPIMSWETEYLQ